MVVQCQFLTPARCAKRSNIQENLAVSNRRATTHVVLSRSTRSRAFSPRVATIDQSGFLTAKCRRTDDILVIAHIEANRLAGARAASVYPEPFARSREWRSLWNC